MIKKIFCIFLLFCNFFIFFNEVLADYDVDGLTNNYNDAKVDYEAIKNENSNAEDVY